MPSAEIVVRAPTYAGAMSSLPETVTAETLRIAAHVEIAAGDPNNYAQVDAAVKAGELNASPFGGSKSGLMQEFTWSGSGKYTLRAHLGAGNLTIGK